MFQSAAGSSAGWGSAERQLCIAGLVLCKCYNPLTPSKSPSSYGFAVPFCGSGRGCAAEAVSPLWEFEFKTVLNSCLDTDLLQLSKKKSFL